MVNILNKLKSTREFSISLFIYSQIIGYLLLNFFGIDNISQSVAIIF
jgi:hypothetical protein